jgi:hypothetical protein
MLCPVCEKGVLKRKQEYTIINNIRVLSFYHSCTFCYSDIATKADIIKNNKHLTV